MKEKVWRMETSSGEELTVFQALFCELPQRSVQFSLSVVSDSFRPHDKCWAGVGDGHGGLACCGSRGHKELDTTDQLN